MSHDEHLVVDVIVDVVVNLQGFQRLSGGILRIVVTGGETQQGVCQVAGVPILTHLAAFDGMLKEFPAAVNAVAVGVEGTHVVAALGIATQEVEVGSHSCICDFAVVFIARPNEGIAGDPIPFVVGDDGTQQPVHSPLIIGKFLLRNAVQTDLCTIGVCRKVALGTFEEGVCLVVAAAEEENQPCNQ